MNFLSEINICNRSMEQSLNVFWKSKDNIFVIESFSKFPL